MPISPIDTVGDQRTVSHGDASAIEEPAIFQAIRQMKLVTEEELQALVERSGGRGLIRQLLLEGFLTDVQAVRLRAQVHGWRFVDLQNTPVDLTLLTLIPHQFLDGQRIVPYLLKDGMLRVACEQPGMHRVHRLLGKKVNAHVEAALSTEGAILNALSQGEKDLQHVSSAILQRHTALAHAKKNDSTIIELVDMLLLHALRRNASDIHIESRESEAVVRERVDGILRRHLTFSTDVHALVVARIKVLAKLAIDEHGAPQDGKLLFTSPEGQRVDVRVSTTPTTHGEKVVLRLLVSQSNAIPLESLGLRGESLAIVEAEYRRAWGMILVTGPTGSGKTTSQYALMRRMNREEVNIATIEDPVEYDLPGINQVQVNEKAGINFATGLRSILRQDPNIILVGEIRDLDTAAISINAAMTGHLVLSTLHTNDAATAVPRLFDMKVEPFLISSTVNLIIGQRLIRRICIRCRESIDLKDLPNADAVRHVLGSRLKSRTSVPLYHGKGCELCHQTGYMGREGIFEVLKVDETIRDMIMRQQNASLIKEAAIKAGMTTMLDDGLDKVLEGITTIDEVMRVMRS